MSRIAELCPTLGAADLELLHNVERGMPITADLSRSDLLLACPAGNGLIVVAQAQPHSISPLYGAGLVGQTLDSGHAPLIIEAWRKGQQQRSQRDPGENAAPVAQDVYPIRGRDGRTIGLLSIETSLIQLERHRQRHPSFRRAIEWLKLMCIRGELAAAESLSPFGEWDGVLLVDAQRRIAYMSGIANNLYRHLGYLEDLRGRRLSYLNTSDDEMAIAALDSRLPLEREVEESSHVWIRKIVPVWAPPALAGRLGKLRSRLRGTREVTGALIMVHDATEERRKRQELKVKTTMVQEVHHRVKNNLQAIAAMLRMQGRRTHDPEALHALNEAVVRILSVAVIHEFLSLDETQTINMRDVCQRIIAQNRQVLMGPGKQIAFSVEGPAISLPSQQATACALVINELIHNALEHGFEKQKTGQVRVVLGDSGHTVRLEVSDDGSRLPDDFDLDVPRSLGLQIVRSLVQDDLRGQLRLENRDQGVVATVEFPRLTAAQGAPRGDSFDTAFGTSQHKEDRYGADTCHHCRR